LAIRCESLLQSGVPSHRFELYDGEFTVNSQRYVSTFENFLGPELGHIFSTIWCYQPRRKRFHVRNFLPNNVISKNGYITWSARSPDLTACDFFLSGYLKSRVFQSPSPRNVQKFKERIRQEVARIPEAMLRNVLCTRLTEYEPKWTSSL
jgi:hypothetical protein